MSFIVKSNAEPQFDRESEDVLAAKALGAGIGSIARWVLIAGLAVAGTLAGPASAATPTVATPPIERPPTAGLPLAAGPQPSTLWSVAALSPSYAWAVGDRATELWNGKHWMLIANPLTHNGAALTSVAAAISATDVWAVGFFGTKNSAVRLHWDGTTWKRE